MQAMQHLEHLHDGGRGLWSHMWYLSPACYDVNGNPMPPFVRIAMLTLCTECRAKACVIESQWIPATGDACSD